MARYTGAMRRAGHLVAVVAVVVSAHAETAEVALAPGEIVIADRGGAGVSGALYRLVAGGVPRAIATTEPLLKPTAVAVDRDGTLVVADLRRLDEPGRVVRVDPVSGAVTSLADGWPLLSPIGVAIDDAGDVLVADLDAGSRLDFAHGSLAGTGAIYRIPHTIGEAILLALDCCRWNASDVTVTPTGDLAVVDLGFAVFSGDGALALVDPRTGIQRPIATSIPLLDPSGVAIGPGGALIVTEATNPQPGNAAILAIEPVTGTVTVLSTGAPITDPRGIATTPAGDLVVADSATQAIYRIDLPERTLSVLTRGAPLVVPWGVTVAPSADARVPARTSPLRVASSPSHGLRELDSARPRPIAPVRSGVSARGIARATILIVAGSVVGLAIAEAGLRAIGFSSHLERPRSGIFTQVTEYDPVLSRRNRPGFVDPALDIRIDALGFRGDEVELAKPAGHVRIACLGDSATFGVYHTATGNHFDGSYPDAIARLARDDGRTNVEVVNAGVLGATSAEGLVLLLVRLRRISPDVLVVRFGNNDHARRWERDTTPLGLDAEYTILHDLPPRLFDLEVSSLLFHVYRQAVAGRRPAAPRRLSPERFETNLRRFVEVGREIGARVVFVDFPYRDATRGLSPGEPLPNPLMAVDSIEALHELHAEYQHVVERVAAATDTPFVRTAAALHAAEAEAFSDWDATHPTPAGQRVIARAILDEVERMGVLPARGAP